MFTHVWYSAVTAMCGEALLLLVLVCLGGCPLDKVLLTHHLLRHDFHVVVVTGNIYLFP